MLHEGNLSGRGGTGLKQNLVVREKGLVQFVGFGFECTAPSNGESNTMFLQTLSKAGWEHKEKKGRYKNCLLEQRIKTRNILVQKESKDVDW